MALNVIEYANKYLDGDGLELVWSKIKAMFATKSEIGNGKLTIQKNGTEVGSFTANQSGDTTINLAIPTADDFAAKNHTHGNITSGGTITATGVDLANNDTLVIVDASDSSKIKQTSIKFDGSTTDQFLSKKGTWSDTVAKATSASTAADSDKLDGKHASEFSLTGHTHAISAVTGLQTALDWKIPTTSKGAANGVAELDVNGKVPSTQLPSYVDDVIEGYLYNGKFYKEAAHTTEISGETGKIYVDLSNNKTYRWSGSAFVEISSSLALGETSSTAYRGDRGKTAYDHATDANRITTATATGLYKVGSTAEGHISGLTAVVKSDITDLGIPGALQNAYSVVKVGSTEISATTTTDKIELAQGSNITLTADASGKKVTIAAKDTTYSFADTYNATTNKGATVATVTNAINALDGVISGTPSTTNTITGFTQENGVVTAKFGAITFPTAGNGKLSLKVNNTEVASFTANQTGDTSFNVDVPTANRLTEDEINAICV